jgi:HD superfamily phosphodiesterase
MLANRRFGFRVHVDDALRASKPARRLRDAVGDDAWLQILETVAFAGALPLDEPTFTDGAGI